MISFRNFSFLFDNNFIFENCDFEFLNKGIYINIADNGTGKTTIFKILIGLQLEYSGSILLNSKELKNQSLKYISSLIGILKSTHLLLDIKASELFEYSGIMNYKDNYFVKYFELERFENKNILHISEGQRQLLLIARVFSLERQIILLDEPTIYLDKSKKKLLKNMINQLSKDKLIIINSHDFQENEIEDSIMLTINNKKLIYEK